MKKITFLTITLIITSTSVAQCWDSFVLGWDFAIAQKTDGSLWAWGSNSYGKLGVANPGTVTTDPHKRVTMAQDWTAFSAGRDHAVALKSNGTLWAWGRNDNGQIGDGTEGIAFSKDTPVRIGTDSDWAAVGTGNEHSLAIKTDGSLWTWGFNNSYTLGDGTHTDRLVPTHIGTATNWKSVKAGYDYSIALTTDGKIYTWGDNGFGQLVLGGTTTIFSRDRPTRAGTATDWKYIDAGDSHTIALKTNNTLWVGGNNYDGQLGLGNNVFTNALVQVGTDTWLDVAAGSKFTIGIKSDGTLWSWGYNFNGQLGNGTTNVNTNTPGQIGTDTDWLKVAAGLNMAMAMKTDGTVYTWGSNSSHQLGTTIATLGFNVPTAIICGTLSTDTFSEDSGFKLYPNPTADFLYIAETAHDTIIKTDITDLTGKLVYSSNQNNHKIDVSPLSAGVYIVQLTTEKGVFQSKFIKSE